MKNVVRDLRLAGWLEGVSYILLLGVAMPLKYLAGIPEAVRITGSLHGFLFIVYVLLGLRAVQLRGWPKMRAVQIIAASILPFGPFFLDRWLRREEAISEAQAGSKA